MKLPKEMKRFCKKCRKHTTHSVKIEKNKGKNKTHPMSKFSQIRLKLRGLWKGQGTGNKGARSRKALNAWKRYNKKSSKKTDLRFTCSDCKYTSVGSTKRTKKIALE